MGEKEIFGVILMILVVITWIYAFVKTKSIQQKEWILLYINVNLNLNISKFSVLTFFLYQPLNFAKESVS